MKCQQTLEFLKKKSKEIEESGEGNTLQQKSLFAMNEQLKICISIFQQLTKTKGPNFDRELEILTETYYLYHTEYQDNEFKKKLINFYNFTEKKSQDALHSKSSKDWMATTLILGLIGLMLIFGFVAAAYIFPPVALILLASPLIFKVTAIICAIAVAISSAILKSYPNYANTEIPDHMKEGASLGLKFFNNNNPLSDTAFVKSNDGARIEEHASIHGVDY